MSTGSFKPSQPPGAPEKSARRERTTDGYGNDSTEVARPRGEDPYLGKIISERYRVAQKLGQGGMGVVYLAEHVLIEKKVAIKILSKELAHKEELVTRFMQEARAASRIGHENVVDITDFGQIEGGSVFIAMELLEGADLATVIREQGPLPFSRVLGIATQICRGLHAAHGKGIIHRDMKPENIYLVEREGRTDFVKILDFGIAKMSSVDDESERLTRTGMIFGTPEYMSPEQARGERPDHRVDVYAVGCILYEMLTGDVPFHAESFMGVLTKHMFEPPEPLSFRLPSAAIAPDVEAVVMRALAKDRDERYLSMRELAMALVSCSGGGGETALASWSETSPTALPFQLSGATRTVADARTVVSQRRPTSRRAPLIGALIVVAGLAVALLLLPDKKSPGTSLPVAPVAAVAPIEPRVAPIPPPPAWQEVIISKLPDGARLMIGSELVAQVKGVKDHYLVPYGKTPISLDVMRPGYGTGVVVITSPDHEGTFELRKPLLPLPAHKGGMQPHRKVDGRAEPPVVVKPVLAVKPEAPPPEPKPEIKTQRPAGELMNPFKQQRSP